MANDRFGVSESITGVDPDAIRFCPIHKLPHDADATHYFGGGRLCPEGGEPLVGFLQRWQQYDGGPQAEFPDWWDLGT